MNIGDDSLPNSAKPSTADAPDRENPIKPGDLTDSCSEPKNEPLAERILQNGGCLLSEYAPDVPARPEFFIERDRLQSGLGLAVVVVETDERGGSMHTIRFGCDQGKVIGAVDHPKQFRSDKSRGNEKLIGAHQATALSDKENLQVFISHLWRRAHERKSVISPASVAQTVDDDQLSLPTQ